MERLQTVKLSLVKPGYGDVCEYIAKHYEKHCISAESGCEYLEMLNIIPAKILTDVCDLEKSLHNFKYVSGLQYLHLSIYSPEEPMVCGWNKYQEILDQCLNLKAVEFTWVDEEMNIISLSQISEPYQNIWQERISYFEARGIRIVDRDEINENENLQTKLAKEADVTWKFQFY